MLRKDREGGVGLAKTGGALKEKSNYSESEGRQFKKPKKVGKRGGEQIFCNVQN